MSEISVVVQRSHDRQEWATLDTNEIPDWMSRDLVAAMLGGQIAHDSVAGADLYYRVRRVFTESDLYAIAAAGAKRARRQRQNIANRVK